MIVANNYFSISIWNQSQLIGHPSYIDQVRDKDLMSMMFVDIFGNSTENETEKLPTHWLTLRQNLLTSSQMAEFSELLQGVTGGCALFLNYETFLA